MLFDSFQFLLFFPAVACLYFALPYGRRWPLLLVASYAFYMAWNPYYIVLIVTSTLVDYVAAQRIVASSGRFWRRLYLGLSLGANLGLLFSFKYFNFFSGAAQDLARLLHMPYATPVLNVLLPVGISFYTFQTLSYTIEVYKGRQEAERHLGRFATYVAFFPQLVAGPIERPQNLLPQFSERHDFDYARIRQGLALMLWGMFKKVVVADRLGEVVNVAYADPARYAGPSMVIATVFFAFQIYCDFSGYSDIAIGCARVMGFRLMTNFDRPYLASNFAMFWRRWHISLSTWFRDYVFLPLGGSRASTTRMARNILIVFVVSGMWHGANWTFLAWGALHGLYYLAWRASARPLAWLYQATRLNSLPRLLKALQVLVVFSLVCLAWIFFRAPNVSEAWYTVSHLGAHWDTLTNPGQFQFLIEKLDISLFGFSLNVLLLTLVLSADVCSGKAHITEQLLAKPVLVRWACYVLVAFAIMNLGVLDEMPFIYFQF
jgi:alginate O-acetyltransferase complex protein AlgI